MTIEVRFQNFKSLQCFHNTVQSARLEEILPYLSVGCYRIIQAGTETRVSEEFWLKTGIKGWQFEDPMSAFSLAELFFLPSSNQLLYFSHLSLVLFFSLTFIPFNFFFCPHLLLCLSLGMFLGSSNRFVQCGGTLQCSNHCWVVLLLLHGTVGGI